MNELKRRGIDTRPYFRTMSSLPMYKQTPQPVAERKAQTGINLPCYVELTQADVRRIAGAVNELLAEMRPNAVRDPATIFVSAVTPFACSWPRSSIAQAACAYQSHHISAAQRTSENRNSIANMAKS